MSIKIIVTGGAGFIGSNLVQNLVLEKGYSVLTIDKLTYAGHKQNLDKVLQHPLHKFKNMDVVDRQMMHQVIHEFRPQWIMHLAAESHVDRSIDRASDFVSTNIVGSHVVAEAAMEYWQLLTDNEKAKFRLLHVSTDEVFGSVEAEGKFSERSPYKPNSPYSATKAAADLLMQAYFNTYKLPVIIANCSNNYGPYQFPEKLIPLCILNAIEHKGIPVYGDGQQIRDWLYVLDHVNALSQIIQYGKLGEQYCIGGNSEKTNLQVVEQICLHLDRVQPQDNGKSYKSLITHVTDRPGHDRWYAIDASKIQQELNWSAKTSFEEGLSYTVDWYLNNLNWVQQVSKGESCVRDRQGLGHIS